MTPSTNRNPDASDSSRQPHWRDGGIHSTPVIMAAARSQRPRAFSGGHQLSPATNPFAPGNESLTPPEIHSIRPANTAPDTPGWQLRVVPNRFAALNPDTATGHESPAEGAHEVIIETPDPTALFHQYDAATMLRVLEAWQKRAQHHLTNPRVQSILVLRNHGPLSGGSLDHPHSQLIASHRNMRGFVPPSTAREDDPDDPARTLGIPGQFRAWCPWASRLPYEVSIAPGQDAAPFTECSTETLLELSRTLHIVTAAMHHRFGEHSWNLLLPTHREAMTPWQIGIFPRLGPAGILELAAGFYINTITPEMAAKQLRDAIRETTEHQT